MDEGRLLCEKNNLPFQINIYCVKCYIELPKRYTGKQQYDIRNMQKWSGN
jgi:hypothetical protein